MMRVMPVSLPVSPRPFHLLAKPIGPICNLDCTYCFYLEKEKLYPGQSNWRMPAEVLEQFIRQFIESQDLPEMTFAWQGGEPTLMGLEFFRRAVAIQQTCANGRRIHNTLQTNGTLLDDAWCEFFREHRFLIGLSIDGPRAAHDRYRVDKQGRPTFDAVLGGLRLLKKHAVDFNALVVVSRANQDRPLDIYQFLKQQGTRHMQFIPLVERAAEAGSKLSFAGPPETCTTTSATPFSVEPVAYGRFLCDVFDYWVRRDIGTVFVQIFDVMLGIWSGLQSSLCVFRPTCGDALALEHNGDVYSCDHYVYPQYRLGNLMQTGLAELVKGPQQRRFGQDKLDTLPKYCRECDVRFACNGECPKHRFIRTPDGEAGLNYLCGGYKVFLRHIDPYMKAMAQLLKQGRPAAELMAVLGQAQGPERNDPCPCGSGKKFKKCCGA